MCKDLSVKGVVNSKTFLIRFLQNSYLSDSKTIASVQYKITVRKTNSDFWGLNLLSGEDICSELLVEPVHRKSCLSGLHIIELLFREKFRITTERKALYVKFWINVWNVKGVSESMSCEYVPIPDDRNIEIVLNSWLWRLIWRCLKTFELSCSPARYAGLSLMQEFAFLSVESFLYALRQFI